jgi:hypothetical protein
MNSSCAVYVLAGAMCAPVLSDVESRPASIRAQVGEWTLIPVGTRAGEGLELHGVLALRDTGAATGENIAAVWYQAPDDPAGEWKGSAWVKGDQDAAVKYLKQKYVISDAWDRYWGVLPANPETPVKAPEAYKAGLLMDDPMLDLTSTPYRDSAIETLTASGYAAADIPFEKLAADSACTKDVVLSALSEAVSYSFAKRDAGEDAFAAAWKEQGFSTTLATCAQVVPPAPPPPPPCGPWGCLPGTTIPAPGPSLDLPWGTPPRWQPAPGSTPVVDPTCTTVTTTCYEEEIVYYYYGRCFLGVTCIKFCKAKTSWTCPGVNVPPCPKPIPITADPTRPVTCDHRPSW